MYINVVNVNVCVNYQGLMLEQTWSFYVLTLAIFSQNVKFKMEMSHMISTHQWHVQGVSINCHE